MDSPTLPADTGRPSRHGSASNAADASTPHDGHGPRERMRRVSTALLDWLERYWADEDRLICSWMEC